MPKSLENFLKFWEELGNLREFPKTSETLKTRFLRSLNNLRNFSKTSETVQRCFPDFFNDFSKFSEKYSDIFASVRKSSEMAQK